MIHWVNKEIESKRRIGKGIRRNLADQVNKWQLRGKRINKVFLMNSKRKFAKKSKEIKSINIKVNINRKNTKNTNIKIKNIDIRNIKTKSITIQSTSIKNIKKNTPLIPRNKINFIN